MNLDEILNYLKNTPSDINEHLDTLTKYAYEVDHVTEFGVRAILTTYAFVKGDPKTLISYDLEYPEYYGGNIKKLHEIIGQTKINFQFKKQDVLAAEIEETDLLFIDTFHAYDQLKAELKLHSSKVRKYIIMHDTVSFGHHDEPLTSLNTINKNTAGLGLVPAIYEFIENNPEWEIREVFENNNGLTVLARKEEIKPEDVKTKTKPTGRAKK